MVFLSFACDAERATFADWSSGEISTVNPSLSVDDVMGAWEVKGGDESTSCVLAFSNLGQSLNRVALAENCTGTPFEGAKCWRLAGAAFEVLNGHDQVIMRFRQRGGLDFFESTSRSAVRGSFRLAQAALK